MHRKVIEIRIGRMRLVAFERALKKLRLAYPQYCISSEEVRGGLFSSTWNVGFLAQSGSVEKQESTILSFLEKEMF